MAIPVARVHLAMAHATLPGLLPSPPKCLMLPPLLPAPPRAAILPSSSPSRPSRADAAGRWDAHKVKVKQGGGSPASPLPPPSSAGQCSLKWMIKKKSAGAGAGAATSSSLSSSSSNGRADSEERWDAHKRPASPTSSSSSSSASSNRTKARHISWRHSNGSRALSSASSADRWDAYKKPRAPPPADELDDGESSTGSNNDTELLLDKAFYAGPGFIRSPEPSMLPKPSFIRVA